MEGYISQISLWAANFAPKNWAFCSGQLLAISQNTALFSLIGTMYGGNGQTTFALPDLQGRVPRGVGSGPGLSAVSQGEKSGSTTHTLVVANLPAHTHTVPGASGAATSNRPGGLAPAKGGSYAASNAAMAPTGVAGAGQPVDHMPPYLGMNYIICLYGIYPSRP